MNDIVDYMLDTMAEFADHRTEHGYMKFDKWTMRAAIEHALSMTGMDKIANIADDIKLTRDFSWDSEKQHHLPKLIIEFEPVPANGPNDAKGWKDCDALAEALVSIQTKNSQDDGPNNGVKQVTVST